MDSNSWIEHIQFQLNLVEFLYQIRTVKGVYKFSNKKNFKKLFYRAFFIIQEFPFHPSPFLTQHFEKYGYFIPSFSHTQPWFFFWLTNAIDLIGYNPKGYSRKNPESLKIDFIFSKGKNLKSLLGSPSLLVLYSAILSHSFLSENRRPSNLYDFKNIYYFLRKIETKNRSFRAYFLGEHDPRGLYCVLIISSICNILTPELIPRIKDFLTNHRNYDGGVSVDKSREGHCGIAFCFLASLLFFPPNEPFQRINHQIKNWISEKESILDFGFHGRFSKISDSCYSFWVGAISIILSIPFSYKLRNTGSSYRERYSLGWADKLGKSPDLYHFSYFLCGLSLFNFSKKMDRLWVKQNFSKKKTSLQIGDLPKLNPVFGLREKVIINNLCRNFFSELKKI
mmetsp:Transcript_32423/g.67021  ORF Transcript_32423/g.67021 Transcript_32423/m.67021 type:complete len:395 (-) Transcript_32423:797-1981(-)